MPKDLFVECEFLYSKVNISGVTFIKKEIQMNYMLINKMTTKPGKRQEVIDIMVKAGKPFDKNASCLLYLLSASKDEPNVIWVQDIWTNKEDHEKAMKTKEMGAYIKQAMPLLKAMPEQFEVEPAGGKMALA